MTNKMRPIEMIAIITSSLTSVLITPRDRVRGVAPDGNGEMKKGIIFNIDLTPAS